jgi:RNA polymerase sigma-32 factor
VRNTRGLGIPTLTEKKQTLHELAAQFGVSAERIRQIEKNAMRKMKTHLEA